MLSEKEIRSKLRDKYGNRNYRIRKDGSIAVCGKMPNTDIFGWFFLGWIDDGCIEQRLSDNY